MIGLQVRGIEATRSRLQKASIEANTGANRMMRLASLMMRKKLALRMSKAGKRDSFWGKQSPKGAFLGARSGLTRIRLSPGGVVIRVGDVLTAPVGSPDKHVRLHEFGGIVKGESPKGFLRIPTAQMQTTAGVDRLLGRSARILSNAFIFRSKAGNLWIASRGRAFQSFEDRNVFRVVKVNGVWKRIKPAPENPIFLSKSRAKTKLLLLYLLKRSVTFRRRKIFETVAKEINSELYQMGLKHMMTVTRLAGAA